MNLYTKSIGKGMSITMKKFALTLLLPILIVIFKPLGISFNQSIILSSLVLTIIWWTVGIIKKSYASIFLLLMFSLFGNTPLRNIYHFLFSSNFVLIVFSFVFSQGIINSGLVNKFLEPLLFKYATNIKRLMLIILISSIGMIFVIPQPFSRVIILGLIFSEFFKKVQIKDGLREILLFWIFASSMFSNMLFLRGDIILNNALLTMANYPISEAGWIHYMTLPSILFYSFNILGFLYIYRKDLKDYKLVEYNSADIKSPLSKKEKKQLILILTTVFLWATESFHGISGVTIVVIGTCAMYFIDLVKMSDLKSVNIELLFFLTAAFSIGVVLKNSGTADIIFQKFIALFPETFSIKYVFIMIITSISLHMILASSVTSMSIVVPGLLSISYGVINEEIAMFIMYISLCVHLILPLHNVITMLGEGNNYYSNKTVLRYTPFLTILIISAILFIYLPWWKLMGLV